MTTLQDPAQKRIVSIDLLRGIIMIIMALDHTRIYFHADANNYDALDLEQTNVIVFLTRWITHFCAPVFVFLSGTSAYLVGLRKGKKELSKFLITRGLWLMLLELTVVNFGWFFNIEFPVFYLIVIWALGLSMVVLAAIIHLPFKVVLAVGLIIVLGHNLLDNIHVEGTGVNAFLWAELHEQKRFDIAGHSVRTGYPVLAWIGIMVLGYCLGALYKTDFPGTKRRKILLTLGISSIVLFLLLRTINGYGDPHPWSTQSQMSHSILSFINVTKYPPSLLYSLIMLGPALIFLAMAEKPAGLAKPIIHIGRVPMFFYLMHLYLIHTTAMIAAELSGFKWSDMILSQWSWLEPQLKGYGFSLGFTYLAWAVFILLLYFPCKWYDKYKTSHKEKWWLSYL
ncbi:MAG: DUF1624 domain-containing protein [Gemmatimonadaceae bacterium]|nr:DUF1624 domain-containing protein [Chitinophagaceae bacterium]